MFQAIAEKVGSEPHDQELAEDGRHLRHDRTRCPTSSPRSAQGKYAAEDNFHLVSYDSSLGTTGDWKKLTPIKDASNGKCAKAG